MSESDQLQELLQRVVALEAREKSLTAASNAYQAIITTMLGNLAQQERDKIIAMIDQAHELAYARAIQRCNEPQKQKNQTGRRYRPADVYVCARQKLAAALAAEGITVTDIKLHN